MNPWLNYHHLFYFKTIANEGSIAKAAETLRLGQPTLSAQLKQFEANLGVTLFERRHKKLILTEQGRVALRYANDIFKTGHEMVEVLRDRWIPTRTHVQIGALDSIPKNVIREVVQFAMEKENCTISLLEGPPAVMVRELGLHRIDLFVSNFRPTPSEGTGLYSRSFARKPVSLYGAPKWKNLRKQLPESLKEVPLLLPTQDSQLRHDVEQWYRLNGLAPDIVAETQDTAVLHLLGLDGGGLFPASRDGVEASLKAGELVEIASLAGVWEEYFLVAASRKIENPVSSHLMKSFSLK